MPAPASTPRPLGPAGSARSLLFVPGTTPARFDKGLASAADLVVLDLEDAVPEEHKGSARAAVVDWLSTRGRAAAVRVNGVGSPHHAQDVAALTGLPGLLAVVVPMACSPEALADLHGRLGPAVEIVALVETATGLLRAADLARVPGVARLAFGNLDFAFDIDADVDAESMLLARSTLVLASRAAGLPGPVDGVTTDLDDPDAVRDDAVRARRLGLTGKLCIHPNQLAAVNAAMSPSEDEITWARQVVDSRVKGAVRLDGQMVDAPVVLKAEAILTRAQHLSGNGRDE
ncbi:HpcH/HpaI aldolase/citrate lyase family protein [Nocardioides allogilvus]|uniref:HpcH/HpaI aldolase/citrate lyase family protein n=1 Tax=Nocardioides allogilvus TaxID=2072017 RepID=UPI000D2FC7AD|nr:CoA ester lyase [Nocardioides allogilvus]